MTVGRRTIIASSLAVVLIVAAAPDAVASKRPSLIGTYKDVTTVKGFGPYAGTTTGLDHIDAYDASTGAISGHGENQGLGYTSAGTVTGNEISLRVIAKGATATNVGLIGPDGTITGTVQEKARGTTVTGSFTMTRLDASVLVLHTGVSAKHIGHLTTLASWGVVLANPSHSNDAVGVNVIVNLVGPNGKAIPYGEGQVAEETLSVIPAGHFFYLGAVSTLLGDYNVQGVTATASIDSTPTKRYGLVPVTGIHIDPGSKEIAGTVTNPYAASIDPVDYTADAVFFDRQGHVIGGDDIGEIGNIGAGGILKPGEQSPVSFISPGVFPLSEVASVEISVFRL